MKPSAASWSATARIQSVSPNISWITTTTGARSFRSGYTAHTRNGAPGRSIVTSSPCRGEPFKRAFAVSSDGGRLPVGSARTADASHEPHAIHASVATVIRMVRGIRLAGPPSPAASVPLLLPLHARHPVAVEIHLVRPICPVHPHRGRRDGACGARVGSRAPSTPARASCRRRPRAFLDHPANLVHLGYASRGRGHVNTK